MAWELPNPAVQYHEPVAPKVPEPDNTAAKIISAGTGPAVQAFIHMAQTAKEAQIAREQMLQSADLHAKQLGMDQERLNQEYGLRSRGMDIEEKYRGIAAENASEHLKLAQELAPYQIANLKALGDERKSTAATLLQTNTENAQMQSQFAKDIADVASPKKWVDNPAQAAFDTLAFAQKWDASPNKEIKQNVQNMLDHANESRVQLTVNPAKGPETFPWLTVAKDYQINGENSLYYQALLDGGHLQSTEMELGGPEGSPYKNVLIPGKWIAPTGHLKEFLGAGDYRKIAGTMPANRYNSFNPGGATDPSANPAPEAQAAATGVTPTTPADMQPPIDLGPQGAPAGPRTVLKSSMPVMTTNAPKASPTPSGLQQGAKRTINGIPATWDGQGWVAD